jgi:uncharacterized membrane protein YgdD (TMEM256/DUF423 family)
MAKLFITLAAFSGMLAVVFGAFGAHALKNKLDDYAMGVFETAVQYNFYHTLALLGVGLLALTLPDSSLLKSSGWLFTVGLVVFSGSLYVLSFTGLRWLGAVTPLGGLAFIAGWVCLAAAAWKSLG